MILLWNRKQLFSAGFDWAEVWKFDSFFILFKIRIKAEKVKSFSIFLTSFAEKPEFAITRGSAKVKSSSQKMQFFLVLHLWLWMREFDTIKKRIMCILWVPAMISCILFGHILSLYSIILQDIGDWRNRKNYFLSRQPLFHSTYISIAEIDYKSKALLVAAW